jgi:hypothetical protein
MIRRLIFLGYLIIIPFILLVYAENNYIRFILGIKIGYEFVERSGIIIGVQGHLEKVQNDFFYGIISGYQRKLSSKCCPLGYMEFTGGYRYFGISPGLEIQEVFRVKPRFRISCGYYGWISYKIPYKDYGNKEISIIGKHTLETMHLN